MFSKQHWWNVQKLHSEPTRLVERLWILVVGAALGIGLSGCADSATGDYRAYSDLPVDTEQVEAAEPVEADSAEPAAEVAEPVQVAEVTPVDASSEPAAAEDTTEPVEESVVSAEPQPTSEADITETEAAPTASADSVAAEEPAPVREVKLLVENREFKTEGPEDALRISYDDFDLLKILNMDPVTPDAPNLLPDWLKDLDGQRVRVRGFMYPPFQETGIVVFVLARDNQICCFGRNPKVYDLVKVTMRSGTSANYIQNRPFDVVGVFHIRPNVDGDTLVMLYEIDDAQVID